MANDVGANINPSPVADKAQQKNNEAMRQAVNQLRQELEKLKIRVSKLEGGANGN